MVVYDSVLEALSKEDNAFRFPVDISREEAIHRCLYAPHGGGREPRLMFAFDHIYFTDNKWSHDLALELYSISSVLTLKEVQALRKLESSMTADLIVNDLGVGHLTANTWDVADMFLYYPRFALPKVYNLKPIRRELLQRILKMNTPERVPAASPSDFFCAYSLGNNIPSQLEAIVWHYLNGSLHQGMKADPGIDDEAFVTSFFDDLVNTYQFEEDDDWPEGKTPSQVMESIALFYNSFMRYRDLLFVKRKLEKIKYDTRFFSELSPFL